MLISCIIKINTLNHKEVLYIGDTLQDQTAAMYNSIKFGYADWGYGCLMGKSNKEIIYLKKIKDILKLINIR